MIKEQADFVASEISYIMDLEIHQGASFSLIAHSVGAYVAYGAIKDPQFPLGGLKNVFSLAGPLNESPIKLQVVGMENLLDDLFKGIEYHKLNNVAHFNISGGPRDLSVPSKTASF
jgi:hypothetical protein